MSNLYFTFNNHTIKYYTKIRESLIKTERIVELALVQTLFEKYKVYDKIIEIGCVSPYYFDISHTVFDIQDSHPLNIQKNAKDVDVKNKLVLSISTVEHFNVHNYNISESDFINPTNWIINTINSSDGYLITFPLGFNNALDLDILSSDINTQFLSRIDNSNYWIQKTKNQLTLKDKLYDFTFTKCANSVAIIQNLL